MWLRLCSAAPFMKCGSEVADAFALLSYNIAAITTVTFEIINIIL